MFYHSFLFSSFIFFPVFLFGQNWKWPEMAVIYIPDVKWNINCIKSTCLFFSFISHNFVHAKKKNILLCCRWGLKCLKLLVLVPWWLVHFLLQDQKCGSKAQDQVIFRIVSVAFVASRISFRIMMNLLMSCLPFKRNVPIEYCLILSDEFEKVQPPSPRERY